MDHSTVNGNTGDSIPGIYYEALGQVAEEWPLLSITDSTIANNSTGFAARVTVLAQASGIRQVNGRLVISGSTVSGNTGGWIGGVYATTNGGRIVNSTISGNSAQYIGGLRVDSHQNEFQITNTTITENSAFLAGGVHLTSANVVVANSIIAANHLTGDNRESDFYGSSIFQTGGNNLFGEVTQLSILDPTGTAAATDLLGSVSVPLNPQLEPLQDNGGPTQTHLPMTGSPVIDAGNSSLASLLSTDQRGGNRIERSAVDIGAVEVANVAPSIAVAADSVTVDEGQLAIVGGTVTDFEGDSVTLSVSIGTIVDNNDGTWSWQLQSDDGPSGGATVTVTAMDEFGATDEVEFLLNVLNVAPVVSVTAETEVEPGQPVAFQLSTTDVSAADQAANFVYSIDWDSDGVVDETLTGGALATVNHVFDTLGDHTVSITATDKDQGVSETVTHVVAVHQPVELLANSSLNLNSADKNKKFEVVILSTSSFDARGIDVSTVIWAQAAASGSKFRDVNHDGLADLVLTFQLSDTSLVDLYRNALAVDSQNNHQTVDVPITGRTNSGTVISGFHTLDLFMTGRALRDMLNSL